MNDLNNIQDQHPNQIMALPLHTPYVTIPLLVIIGICWLYLEFIAGGSTNLRVLVQYGANFGLAIIRGETWRFFTSMFLHIGIAHLLFNSYALFIFGIEMERIYGTGRFLSIYVLSGLYGSLASFSFSGQAVISAGASGAIFGIIGMNLAFFWFHKDQLGNFGKQQLMNTYLIVTINIFYGIVNTHIDNFAHLGGLIAGIILGFALSPRYEVYKVEGEVASGLRDTISLRNRWWVVFIAVLLLWSATQLSIYLWNQSFNT
jgi:rhomboid protease GluP